MEFRKKKSKRGDWAREERSEVQSMNVRESTSEARRKKGRRGGGALAAEHRLRRMAPSKEEKKEARARTDRRRCQPGPEGGEGMDEARAGAWECAMEGPHVLGVSREE